MGWVCRKYIPTLYTSYFPTDKYPYPKTKPLTRFLSISGVNIPKIA